VVQFVLVDGSVRPLSLTVDMPTFADLATIGGGESKQMP
jgi:hypothetical protein